MKIGNASVDVRHLHALLNRLAPAVPEAPIHIHIYLTSAHFSPNVDQLLDEMMVQKNRVNKKIPNRSKRKILLSGC